MQILTACSVNVYYFIERTTIGGNVCSPGQPRIVSIFCNLIYRSSRCINSWKGDRVTAQSIESIRTFHSVRRKKKRRKIGRAPGLTPLSASWSNAEKRGQRWGWTIDRAFSSAGCNINFEESVTEAICSARLHKTVRRQLWSVANS